MGLGAVCELADALRRRTSAAVTVTRSSTPQPKISHSAAWLALFPLAQGPTRYAEGLAWYVPQYLYLGIGLAALECRMILALRRRYPSINNVRAFSVAFVSMFLADIVIEQLFIRTHVYAFPRTWHALTLFSPHGIPVSGLREPFRCHLRGRVHRAAHVGE